MAPIPVSDRKSYDDHIANFWEGIVSSRLAHYDSIARSTSSSLIVNTLQDMDSEHLAMQHAMRAFLSRRNALTPVCRLPPELLARIFKFHADDERAGWSRGMNSSEILGWIRVTHVCWRWRHVAIEHSNLWQDIAIPLGDDWVEEMLARAREAPISVLTFAGDLLSPLNARHVELIGAHLFHLQRLGLHGSDLAAHDLVQALVQPAPMLEQLGVQGNRRSPLVALPANFLGGVAPRLRHVSLENTIHIPWATGVLNGLTSLTIDLSGKKDPHPPPLDSVVSGLGAMRNLQHLTLRYCLPRNTRLPSLPFPHSTAALPHLATLALSGRRLDCAVMLLHLETPSTVKTTVVSDYPSYDGGFPSIFDALSAHRRGGGAVHTLKIISKLLPGYSIESVQVLAWYPDHTTRQPSHSLTFTSSDRRLDLLRDICRAFVTASLKTFVLDVVLEHELWDAQVWREMLGRATGLQDVSALSNSATSLVQALNTEQTGSQSSADAKLFLPALTSLSVSLYTFGFSAWQISVNLREGQFSTGLSLALAARVAAGSPLKVITFHGSKRAAHTWIEELEQVVTVRWAPDTGQR
ncbi:hypothetical protein BV25DRAFT_1830587 [Artomyces pyxidatus]|uniref:Uncharacterized protein n=1 Tax=Artomyces pyxidatus TaxID=48021 RepID=A0ACB8SNM5_9AGAM|nr:hypothetical protein BV25DRAFT_1830587 [Artomyces pyxidatus]